MTNLELADALQAEFPGYEVVDVAAAVLRNLHTENTALRVTEDNLRQELQECQDQRRAAFRRIEELDAMRAQIGQGVPVAWLATGIASGLPQAVAFSSDDATDMSVNCLTQPLYTLKGIKGIK